MASISACPGIPSCAKIAVYASRFAPGTGGVATNRTTARTTAETYHSRDVDTLYFMAV